MYKLRPHQEKMQKKLHKAWRKEGSHVLYQAPTGFGKSICILDLCNNTPGRIIVMAPTRKLIKQLFNTLSPLKPAVMVPNLHRGNPQTAQIVITTPMTLNSRLKKNTQVVGDIDLIIVDEAHIGMQIKDGAPSKGISEIYTRFWTKAKWVGFTATPITLKGYRLEGWDITISKYSTSWLIKHKFLADFNYFAKPAIDMSTFDVQSTGDYSEKDIETAALEHAAVDSVIKFWNLYTRGGQRKSMIFAASINHAELLASSIDSVIVHSKMSEDLIQEAFDKFQAGVVKTIISVSMLTAGFDDPEVEVQLLARGTASKRLALQMWGRVLRAHPGLPVVDIIDLAGVYTTTALYPTDKVDYNLTKDSKTIEPVMLVCPHCDKVTHKSACERVVNEELEIVEWFCPYCNKIIDSEEIRPPGEKTFEEVEELILIEPINKRLRRADKTIKYSGQDYTDAVEQMRSRIVPRTKPGWTGYIVSKCAEQDSRKAKRVLRAYMQGILSISEAWKLIMELYDA